MRFVDAPSIVTLKIKHRKIFFHVTNISFGTFAAQEREQQEEMSQSHTICSLKHIYLLTKEIDYFRSRFAERIMR